MAQLTMELADLELALANLQKLRAQQQQCYSVVPYKGIRGDDRKPHYVECVASGCIFHPERLALTGATFSPLNVRAELDRRIETRNREGTGEEKTQKPYVFTLVRPDGLESFYALHTALAGLKVDLGYELIDTDWVLDFSAGKVSPGQDTVAMALPPPVASGNGKVVQGFKGNIVGLSGTAPPNAVPGNGKDATDLPWRPKTNNGPPGIGGNAVPPAPTAVGTGKAVQGFKGNIGGSTGTAPPGPVPGDGNQAPDLPWRPKTGNGPPGIGGNAALPGFAGTSDNGVATGNGATGAGKGPGKEGTTSTGNSAGAGSSLFPTGSGFVNGATGDPIQPGAGGNKLMANGSGTTGPASGMAGVGSASQPAIGAWASDGSSAGNSAGSGAAASAGKTPGSGSATATGSSGGNTDGSGAVGGAGKGPGSGVAPSDNAATGSEIPGTMLPFSEPKNSVAKKPVAFVGKVVSDRDWNVTLSCTAKGVKLLLTQEEFSLAALQTHYPGEHPIHQAVRQLVEKKQATVRPGEPPYRPTLRFEVPPDGLRPYLVANAVLQDLGLPVVRHNFNPNPPKEYNYRK
jgi:hypothetical protein